MLPIAFGLGMAGNLLDSFGQHKQEEKQKKQIRAALNQKIADARAEKNQLGVSSQEAMNRAGQMLAKYKDNPQMTERSQQIYDSGLRYNESLYTQANRVQQEANAELKNYGKSKFNWGSGLAQSAVAGVLSNSMYGDKVNNIFSGLLGKLSKPSNVQQSTNMFDNLKLDTTLPNIYGKYLPKYRLEDKFNLGGE